MEVHSASSSLPVDFNTEDLTDESDGGYEEACCRICRCGSEGKYIRNHIFVMFSRRQTTFSSVYMHWQHSLCS